MAAQAAVEMAGAPNAARRSRTFGAAHGSRNRAPQADLLPTNKKAGLRNARVGDIRRPAGFADRIWVRDAVGGERVQAMDRSGSAPILREANTPIRLIIAAKHSHSAGAALLPVALIR